MHPHVSSPHAPSPTTATGSRTAVDGARLIAPDAARGLTLLGIAGANVTTAWVQAPDAPLAWLLGGVYENSLWDKIAVIFACIFFHVRGLPMFSTLLGFGIGLIAASLYRRHYPLAQARRVIVKRYGWLAVFGLIHTVFIFYGDIMLFYGLAGMLLATMITMSDKLLLILAGVMFAANTLMYLGIAGLTLFAGNLGTAEAVGLESNTLTGPIKNYLDQLTEGAVLAAMSPMLFVAEGLMLLPLMLVGMVAARRGVFKNPAAFRRHLLLAMWIAVAVMLGIGLPTGLAMVGVLPTALAMPLFMVNNALGVLTGPGIIAAIILATMPAQRRAAAGQRPGVLLRMVLALGKRSMTGYLLQSVFFGILVAPWGLGLSQGQGAAESTLMAVVVWVLTLVCCGALELANKPGPFEWAHRRLSYGKTGLATDYRASHPVGIQGGNQPQDS
ncbi:DUF418 domain-containing protein [Corynebacterium epidermidicanis]|uniref:Putative membrane protein n=1 Tax=Corynebacterium epidermidicanis TaxID=1050174 RepID=A0A0G3GRX4_9CORY|nr:DUF418 domain-containing protein [Corynebacterium epidermidicanis]AKK03310.1 putative membrane protein [Corynebacterium epidermidicanis]